MTKSQLIDAVVARSGQPRKVVEVAVTTMLDSIVHALEREERVEVRGFGNFTVRRYKAYTGRNPRTGARVDVPGKRMPFFKVGKELRERINEGGAAAE